MLQYRRAMIAQQAAAAGFPEQGVTTSGTTYLTAPAKIAADSGGNLFFASYIYSTSGAREILMSHDGTNFYDAHLGLGMYRFDEVVPGASNFLSSNWASLPTDGDRFHVLWRTYHDGTNLRLQCSIWDETNGWQDQSPASGGTVIGWNTSASGAYRLLANNIDGSDPFGGTLFRIALWTGLASTPDVTSSTVRDNFVSGAGLVDPAISRTAYGTSALEFDCYGNAATWNSGSFTYGPSFTVTGSFTDA